MATAPQSSHSHPQDGSKRDFIVLSATAMAGVGAAATLWPFVDSMNPSADVLAMASIEVNLAPIAEGQEIKVMWRGKPVFIRHRTAKDIDEARAVDVSTLVDPQTDEERVKEGHEQWLVMVGVCTHLGCVPIGNHSGDYDGWFCPCHFSHYDTAGRIRKGPAPKNLIVPEYAFLADDRIKLG
tara:strand:+ start:226 stop:771 length:546 start_codon:yes stop_codon:yes gene_type:complete